jgi:hypothetical protein
MQSVSQATPGSCFSFQFSGMGGGNFQKPQDLCPGPQPAEVDGWVANTVYIQGWGQQLFWLPLLPPMVSDYS